MIINREKLNFKSQKLRELESLSVSGNLIPRTLIISPNFKENEIHDCLEKFENDFVYIRLNFSDDEYPHYYAKVCPLNDTIDSLRELINKAAIDGINRFDLFVQPLLNIEWSIALLALDDKFLLETVLGAPKPLFRGGVFLHRLILSKELNILDRQKGMQKRLLFWENGKWINEEIKFHLNFPIELVLKKLKSAELMSGYLYETGLIDEKLFFLDKKKIRDESFCTLKESNKLVSPFTIYPAVPSNGKELIKVDFPRFEYINKASLDKIFQIKEGAYLSHFVTELIRKKINSWFLN